MSNSRNISWLLIGITICVTVGLLVSTYFILHFKSHATNRFIPKLLTNADLSEHWPLDWIQPPNGAMTHELPDRILVPGSEWAKYEERDSGGFHWKIWRISFTTPLTINEITKSIESQLALHEYRHFGSANLRQYIAPNRQDIYGTLFTSSKGNTICEFSAAIVSPAMPEFVWQRATPII